MSSLLPLHKQCVCLNCVLHLLQQPVSIMYSCKQQDVPEHGLGLSIMSSQHVAEALNALAHHTVQQCLTIIIMQARSLSCMCVIQLMLHLLHACSSS